MIISEISRSIMINISSNLRQSLISTLKIHISEFHMMKYLYGGVGCECRLFKTQPELMYACATAIQPIKTTGN